MNNILNLKDKITILIVTHRFTFLNNVDNIYILKKVSYQK